jgi:hypothetical protein
VSTIWIRTRTEWTPWSYVTLAVLRTAIRQCTDPREREELEAILTEYRADLAGDATLGKVEEPAQEPWRRGLRQRFPGAGRPR